MTPTGINAIDSLITVIANLLSPLSPFAKAIVAPAAALLTAVVNMLIAGSFDTTSIVVLGVGVLAGLATFLIPNKAKAKPTPVTPAPIVPPAGK